MLRFVGSLLVLVSLLCPTAALACCCAGPKGVPIDFGTQTNLIVWEAEKHIEHFVRNAAFHSKATDFAFIAPTPSQPVLSEADQDAFHAAQHSVDYRPPSEMKDEASKAAAGAEDGVEVLQQVKLSGYDIAVLASTDSKKLLDWLTKHGYSVSPEIQSWLDFYIAKQVLQNEPKNTESEEDLGSLRIESTSM